MGTRYICDSCGKEFDMKGGIVPNGYSVPYGMPLEKWAVITYMEPKAKEKPEPDQAGRIYGVCPANMSAGYLVCSQACAEKVLAEIGTHLQAAFDKAVQ